MALCASVALVFGLWSVHNVWLVPVEAAQLRPNVREPLVVGLRVLVWLPLFWWHLTRYEARRLPDALGLAAPTSVRSLLWICLAGAGYLALSRVLAQSAAQDRPQSDTFAHALLSAHMLWVLLVVLLEELVLRGFLLGQLLLHMRRWPAQLATAIVYAMFHLPGWIAHDGWHIGIAISALVVFVLGLLLGWTRVVSGSLYPAIGLHFVSNFLTSWLDGGQS